MKASNDEDSSNDLVIVDDIFPPARPKSVLSKIIPSTSTTIPSKKRKKRDSASSDEERWLTAIESGKLEDVDEELKKIKPKDPALMTARQRAMYDRGAEGSPQTNSSLMSLPTGYKEKVMTAESIQKAAIKSQKRKQMADEKREKDKKKTMDRLLKKQESKTGKGVKSKSSRTATPLILYRQSIDATFINYPEGLDYPLKKAVCKEPPKKQYCIMNCGNLKKYSCSKTAAPLCSLQCYKNNISSRII